MIQDLSFPRKDPNTRSVNSFIDSDDFPTAWGTFSATVDLILSLPPGCKAATFDISMAYRITPIHPNHQNFICVAWKGMVYVDRAACFGLASSAGIFGTIADMLVAIYKASGYHRILKWVDDFFVIALPSDTWSEGDFIELTGALGVPWSLEKLRPLAFIQRYIGFDWDLANQTVSLPKEKLQAVIELAATWTGAEMRVSWTTSARLHGKITHILSIFRLICPFLRSLARFSASFTSH